MRNIQELYESEKLEKGNSYVVNWVDSCGSPAGWVSLENEKYPTEVQQIVSYGTLINFDSNAIVLAQSYIKGSDVIQKQAMGIVVIPVACIEGIRRV